VSKCAIALLFIVSLCSLREWIAVVVDELLLVETLVHNAVFTHTTTTTPTNNTNDSKSKSLDTVPAATTATITIVRTYRLLSLLYDHYSRHQMMAHVHSSLTGLLFTLFYDTFVPYVRILEQWTTEGTIEDPHDEFMIQHK
jgi:hypothetical protein